jgi:hypothetical protein
VSVPHFALHPLLQHHSAEPLLAGAHHTAAIPSSASVPLGSDSPSSHPVAQSTAVAHQYSDTVAEVPPTRRLVSVRIAGLVRTEHLGRRDWKFGKR